MWIVGGSQELLFTAGFEDRTNPRGTMVVMVVVVGTAVIVVMVLLIIKFTCWRRKIGKLKWDVNFINKTLRFDGKKSGN